MSTNENSLHLGKSSLSKLLLKFSIPCVIGLLIGAFYNIVDQIFIGNSELGFLGNAATGVSFPIICIANAFAWCIGDGAASYLSICAGRKDTNTAHKSIGTGISSTIIISIILVLICEIFCEPLMYLFGASSLTIDMAITYFRIVVAFFPFYLLFNVMNSMIRADGSPTYAMIALLIGAIINVVLDPIFIFVFKWGIAGAAWATAIGQVISCILCIIYFIKPKNFKLGLKSFIIDKQILKLLISLGGATFVTQISIVVVSMVGNICLSKYGATSIYGENIPIAVFSIQSKVYTIVCNIVTGIVLGAQPVFGYNYGAKKIDRVKKLYGMVLLATVIVGVLATLIFQFCPEVIINLFGSGNELYMDFAKKTFRIYLGLMAITCLVKMTAVFFQSIGKSIRAICASLIRDIVCFASLSIILSNYLESKEIGKGIMGVLYSAPIADFIALIVIVVLTVSFFKHIDKVNETTIDEDSVSIDETIIKSSSQGVIITISREHGTKGKQIGKIVAERLGIPFYYKEMTALAAKESGLDKDFITDLNKNATTLYDLYLSTNVGQQAILAQEKIIRKIADNGSCVIVGRAADFVLKDYSNVINIFIFAPLEYKTNNLMKMYDDNKEMAIKNVKRSDDARAIYYRNISAKKWGDKSNYDLCVDASIGVEETASLICLFIEKHKNNPK